MKTSFRTQQAGITLIEVSIGLIIAAIVAAVAFIAFQNNSRRNEVRENVAAITEVIAEAKQKFGRTGTFAELGRAVTATTPDIAVTSGVVSALQANQGNSYGGGVRLYNSTLTGASQGATGEYATLFWGKVTANQCYDIVSSLAGASLDILVVADPAAIEPSAVAVETDFAAPTAADSSVYTLVAPKRFDPARANNICDDLEENGDVYFVFNRG
ncbi:MAG TPA: prepilin-type N-terminal cleavage/methylation domain-containing protein [Limnobacter sp.]|nr:prepilin-type N-terminal cleavage/methylation domain-containing protein [Limnobacter sp.]